MTPQPAPLPAAVGCQPTPPAEPTLPAAAPDGTATAPAGARRGGTRCRPRGGLGYRVRPHRRRPHGWGRGHRALSRPRGGALGDDYAGGGDLVARRRDRRLDSACTRRDRVGAARRRRGNPPTPKQASAHGAGSARARLGACGEAARRRAVPADCGGRLSAGCRCPGAVAAAARTGRLGPAPALEAADSEQRDGGSAARRARLDPAPRSRRRRPPAESRETGSRQTRARAGLGALETGEWPSGTRSASPSSSPALSPPSGGGRVGAGAPP